MVRYLPAPPPDPTVPQPSRTTHRLLFALVAIVLALALCAAGYRWIKHTAARQKARFAQRAADEKAARAAWADVAQKISSTDRLSLAAFARVPAGSVPPQFRSGVRAQVPAQIVTRNQAALAALRGLLPLPYRPESDVASSRRNGLYVGMNFRPLTNLLLVDGVIKQNRSDVAGAASAYADVIQMGQTLRRGGAITTLLSSAACDQMGRSALWKLLPSLDAQTARKLARRLEEQSANDDAWYANALREEQTLGNTALADAFDNPKKLQQLQQNARVSAIISVMLQSQSGMRGAFNLGMINAATNRATEPTPLPTLYNRGMQKWEEWKARQSFGWSMGAYGLDAHQSFQLWRMRSLQAQATAAAASAAQSGRGRMVPSWFPASQTPQRFPYTVYTSYGSPGMIEFAQSQITETQTGSRLLRVACALTAYRLEHNGRDPNALADLVPAYLSRIPDDPYAFPVEPLAYTSPARNASPNNTRGTLYSVGPDGVDDGGVVPQGTIRRFGMGYYYGGAFSQSIGSGDLVAGKNAP